MEVLNLDAYAKPKRVLNFKGKSYEVKGLSVQGFIDNLAEAEELVKARDEGRGIEAMRRSMERSVERVQEAIPDLAASEIADLPVEAMTALLAFIRGELDAQAAAGADPAPAAEGDAAKKS